MKERQSMSIENSELGLKGKKESKSVVETGSHDSDGFILEENLGVK